MSKYGPIIGISIWLVGFFVFWIAESELLQILSSQNGLVNNWFPFIGEKLAALEIAELTSIVEQWKWRWLTLGGFAWYLIFFPAQKQAIISVQRQLWMVRLLMVLQMLYLPDLAKELAFRASWAEIYQPLPQFKWLLPTFLPYFFHQWVILGLFGIGAYSILKKWPVESPAWLGALGITIFAWTILLAQLFGFGKIDHTYSSLLMGLIGMWIWLAFQQFNSLNSIFGFRLFQAFIWCCYFFSGLEKLLFSGFHWFSDVHFQQLVFQHPTELGKVLDSVPALGSLLLAIGFGFQLLTFLQWRFPIWGFVNAIAAIVFHLGTYFIFNIGGWQSPWILMALFLLPVWEQKKKAPNGA